MTAFEHFAETVKFGLSLLENTRQPKRIKAVYDIYRIAPTCLPQNTKNDPEALYRAALEYIWWVSGEKDQPDWLVFKTP